MSSSLRPWAVFRSTFYAFAASLLLYCAFLGILTVPYFQNHIIYLNSLTQTGGQDVNSPEQWGFLRNQVVPFQLATPDGETLHAWHVLPLGLYQKHEDALVQEPTGLARDITQRLGFKMLRDDPEALLVLYFHGAGGTLASGWRPPSYRAMSAAAPDKIHTVAIDYRGFGLSTGSPSEDGLLIDATALADWALRVAGIPPSRIVVFAQSLGTAVSTSLAQFLATRPDPVLFSGIVLVAPFADVELLTATYRVAGTLPLLDPLARFPQVLAWLNTFITSKWPTKDRLADLVKRCESMPGDDMQYHVTIIHAEDDYTIPWSHSDLVYWHALNASDASGITFQEFKHREEIGKTAMGEAGWSVKSRTPRGFLAKHITKYGVHDIIMSHPIVSRAILRAFMRDS